MPDRKKMDVLAKGLRRDMTRLLIHVAIMAVLGGGFIYYCLARV